MSSRTVQEIEQSFFAFSTFCDPPKSQKAPAAFERRDRTGSPEAKAALFLHKHDGFLKRNARNQVTRGRENKAVRNALVL